MDGLRRLAFRCFTLDAVSLRRIFALYFEREQGTHLRHQWRDLELSSSVFQLTLLPTAGQAPG